MRKTTIGVFSFALGALCAALLGSFNPHTSTVRQFFDVAFAQTTAPLMPQLPSHFAANPWTPPIPVPPRSISSGNIIEDQVVQLDGRNSEGETIRRSTVVYGGGAYRLVNAKVEGVQLVWVGAAANTVRLMNDLGLLGQPLPTQPKRQQPINPNTPRIELTTIKAPISGDLISQYDGTK
jgi:hypothetical protein